MRIIDDEGKELPHDGKAYGELQVRGPHVIQRYYRVTRIYMKTSDCFRGASRQTTSTICMIYVVLSLLSSQAVES